MALINVKDKQTGAETTVSEEWLERWPDDYERLEKAPKKVVSEFPAPIEAQPGGEPVPADLSGFDATSR